MQFPTKISLAVLAILAVTVTGAWAGTIHDFEAPFTLGDIHGQGNWVSDGFFGPDSAQVSTAQAHTGDQSMRIFTASSGDSANCWTTVPSVEEPSAATTPTSGQWVVSYQTYVPSEQIGWLDASITSSHGAAHTDQGVYMRYNNSDGTVSFNVPWGGRAADDEDGLYAPLPLVYDTWVETKMEIDLDNDTLQVYYDGTPMYHANADWFRSGGDGIGGAIFWCSGGVLTDPSEWFIDDLSISSAVIPEPTTLVMLPGLGLGLLMFRRRR